MEKSVVILLVVALVVLVLVCPFVTAWAINVIFGTSIVVTWKVWWAITWFHLYVGAIKAGK